jgi:hypothetical protein
MNPTTIIYRWAGLILTCCHPDPDLPATWELEAIHRHPYDHDTRTHIDAGQARNMLEARCAGIAAAQDHMSRAPRNHRRICASCSLSPHSHYEDCHLFGSGPCAYQGEKR